MVHVNNAFSWSKFTWLTYSLNLNTEISYVKVSSLTKLPSLYSIIILDSSSELLIALFLPVGSDGKESQAMSPNKVEKEDDEVTNASGLGGMFSIVHNK